MDYWLSDDHDSYNSMLPDRVTCLVHRLRHRARCDERVQALQSGGELAELRRYLQDEYKQLYNDLIERLTTEYPAFWDEETETFTGPVCTNEIEGGNWQLKYGLRVASTQCQTACARTALIAVRDSMSTFITAGWRRASLTATAGSVSSRCSESPQHDRWRRPEENID